MTDALFVLMVGMVGLVLQTTSWAFMMPAAYKPDVILILVLRASFKMTFVIGVGFAFCGGRGHRSDSLASPTGLFAIIYCFVFVACGFLDSAFRIDDLSSKAVTVFGATLAAAVIVCFVRWLSGPFEFDWSVFRWVLLKSVIAAATSLLVFPVVDRLWARYSRVVSVH